MAVRGDRVIIGRVEAADGTVLDIYELTNWDDFVESIPVTYGPDLAVGSERELSSLEADRDTSDYTGLLTRAPNTGGSSADDALPSAIIRIDETGQAEKIVNVPASTNIVTLRNEKAFKDGYEKVEDEQ